MLRPGMVPRTLPFAPRARFPAVLVPGRGGAGTVSPSLGPPPTADVRPCTAREDGRTRRSGAGVDTRTHSRCAGGARREVRSARFPGSGAQACSTHTCCDGQRRAGLGRPAGGGGEGRAWKRLPHRRARVPTAGARGLPSRACSSQRARPPSHRCARARLCALTCALTGRCVTWKAGDVPAYPAHWVGVGPAVRGVRRAGARTSDVWRVGWRRARERVRAEHDR